MSAARTRSGPRVPCVRAGPARGWTVGNGRPLQRINCSSYRIRFIYDRCSLPLPVRIVNRPPTVTSLSVSLYRHGHGRPDALHAAWRVPLGAAGTGPLDLSAPVPSFLASVDLGASAGLGPLLAPRTACPPRTHQTDAPVPYGTIQTYQIFSTAPSLKADGRAPARTWQRKGRSYGKGVWRCKTSVRASRAHSASKSMRWPVV